MGLCRKVIIFAQPHYCNEEIRFLYPEIKFVVRERIVAIMIKSIPFINIQMYDATIINYA